LTETNPKAKGTHKNKANFIKN